MLRQKLSFDLPVIIAIALATSAAAGLPHHAAALGVGVAALLGFATGMLVNGRRLSGLVLRSWLLLGSGLALSVMTSIGGVDGPLGQQWLAQPGVPVAGLLTVAGAYRMLHHRLPGRAGDITSEVTLTVAALGFLAWVLLTTVDGLPDGAARAQAIAAPLVDIVALWLLTRLVSLTERYPASYRYVMGSLVCALIVHAATAATALTGQPMPIERLQALELWSFCLLAAAALHPSVRERFEPVPPRNAPPGAGQLAVVAAVAVAGPLTLAVRVATGADVAPAALLVSAVLPLLVVAHLARQVFNRASAEYRAQHDALTGLPNRTLFHDRVNMAIAHARRSGGHFGVLFLDLDRFKNVNDSLGHDVGNLLLQGVGDRLRRTLREEDTVARMGGDEFTVLLPEITSASDCDLIAEKLLEAFEQPFAVQGRQLVASVSIGVAVYPADGSDAEALLKHSDTAMYRAKSDGRATFQRYSSQMSARARLRHSLESNLHAAVERGELVLHYQPKVSLRDLSIVGVEALARWRHPRLGYVPPEAFIAVAEESGLILTLGEWALEEACRQGQAWRDAGVPEMAVAVNLSARQFTQQDVPALVASVLEHTGFDGRLLELELTESIFLRDIRSISANLHRLRGMEVRCSIDDFGTGFSGLQYLADMPISALKIDRSYVSGIGKRTTDTAIVEAVVALAHSLGMAVVAEGVETLEQAQFLVSQGCEQIQGYLVSRALPAEQMGELLRLETTPAGAIRALAADVLGSVGDGEVPPLSTLDPGIVQPLLVAACAAGAGDDVDLDVVAVVLRALQVGEPRVREDSWSKSVPMRVALGTFSGLLPLSGGMAAAGSLPGAGQGIASSMLANIGIVVPGQDQPLDGGGLLLAGGGSTPGGERFATVAPLYGGGPGAGSTPWHAEQLRAVVAGGGGHGTAGGDRCRRGRLRVDRRRGHDQPCLLGADRGGCARTAGRDADPPDPRGAVGSARGDRNVPHRRSLRHGVRHARRSVTGPQRCGARVIRGTPPGTGSGVGPRAVETDRSPVSRSTCENVPRPGAPNRCSGWSSAGCRCRVGPMANSKTPYDRVAKLPKQFKPLKAYEAERRRGLMHTPEHEERMRLLKDEFQRWLLAE